MRVAYFVHDLTDAAVAKRVRMLREAGAEIVLIGFRRGEEPLPAQPFQVVDLGRTYDARLSQRTLKLAAESFRIGRWAKALEGVDVFFARTLEMLLLASVARRNHRPDAGLAYECLDIHRLMVSDGAPGRALRLLERALMRQAGLLVVSSPAFIREYFEPRQGLGAGLPVPVLLVENKVFEPDPPPASVAPQRAPGRPWKIGWFGAIRCRKSLDILCDLAARRPELLQVIIRGKPARTEFDDFDGQVARSAGTTFGGPYTHDDLPALYGEVHFAWAIDFFEEGANSRWLLPNRIYEGGLHGAAPIALDGVETGAWLSRNGLGVLLSDPASDLERFLEGLDENRYRALERASLDAPRHLFAAGRDDCRHLTDALAGTMQ